jgi:hypothetical protein
MRPSLSRRAVLRGAGGVAVGLPWLEASAAPKAGAGATPPRRFVVFFTGSGTLPDLWRPTGTETAFELPPILAPLEEHKRDLLLLTGIDNVAHLKSRLGVDHPKGMGTMLTGAELLPGNQKNGPKDEDTFGWPNGCSVDQKIAEQVGGATRFRSVEFGVDVWSTTGGSLFNRMIFAGPNRPVPPEDDPSRMFARLFATAGADPSEMRRLREERKSVLDRVLPRYARLAGLLGAADRLKVEAHMSALRDIERGLASGAPAASPGCRRPDRPAAFDHRANENFPAAGRMQMDLLVMALACDLTRVASLQWNKATSRVRHEWVGVPDEHHELSHSGDRDLAATDKLRRITTWYASQFAYLIERLRAIPDGDGTLLDNTVVLWTSEVAKGNNHSAADKPYLLGGRAGGALRTGRWLDYGKGAGRAGTEPVPHNDLLVSLMNALDVEATTFGNPEYCTGPLRGLL